MTGFVDVYLSNSIPGYPCISVPMTSTSIGVTAGGKENRNANWTSPRYRYVLPEAVAREWDVIETLRKHWLITRGPYRSFPWRDPLDFASVDLLEPNEPLTDVAARTARTDQTIGTGDGANRDFQLSKTYSVTDNNSAAQTFTRTITLPRVSTLKVEVGGKAFDDATQPGGAYSYTLTRPGGVITFDRAIPNATVVKAGFLFDVEVRFESDDTMESMIRTYTVGGFSDLSLVEVRPC